MTVMMIMINDERKQQQKVTAPWLRPLIWLFMLLCIVLNVSKFHCLLCRLTATNQHFAVTTVNIHVVD